MDATKVGGREPLRALAALAAEWNVPCGADQIRDLLAFGELLLRWNAKINLTGAGSLDTLVESHYVDAFALASRLSEPLRLIDVGSGGGLPALPLALLRPQLHIQLCEPIAKKGAFLRTAIRELGLAERVRLDTRRGEEIANTAGAGFDAAVSRATLAPEAWLVLGRRLARAGGRVFVLTTPPHAPAGALGRSIAYADDRRLLLEVTA
ncbi:MAG TPA: RsmG family class I SAM-dependent methyltransferase [Polyangia bacterium]|nr:RsmG family class I SAM-dependent methyltransferase [Polyangia bacterium]